MDLQLLGMTDVEAAARCLLHILNLKAYLMRLHPYGIHIAVGELSGSHTSIGVAGRIS